MECICQHRSVVKMEEHIELENYANLLDYKIIAVTESWATSEISDSESLDGFALFRKDRCDVTPGKGGGVLYVSNELSCAAVDTLNAFKYESTWIEVKDDLGANVIVGVCYKSPVVEQELKEMFNAISEARKSRRLIVGDFNYPNINCDN